MRVCLVGATHPCHNPRLVREADSLAASGHTVRVVAPSFMPALAAKDRRLLARRGWRLDRVDFQPLSWRRRAASILIRGRRRGAARLFPRLPRLGVAARGYGLAGPELAALAAREPADWYIAHTQAVLPAAAAAAARWHAHLGCDCEDLLALLDPHAGAMVRAIERAYLPACAYVSVPSAAAAAWLAGQYPIAPPLVLYNVFPQILAAGLAPPAVRPPRPGLRLHWMGQTIGPGRGVEDVVAALGLLGPPVELHLRGAISPSFQATLAGQARRLGVGGQLHFCPQVDHDDLIGTLGAFDVGLAPEEAGNMAMALTVTNKLFSYLLAGLAVAASDTPGQREVLEQVPGAGLLYAAGDAPALAAGLRRWLADPAALRAAQQAAWAAARQRFCWDCEQVRFLDRLAGARPVGTAAPWAPACG